MCNRRGENNLRGLIVTRVALFISHTYTRLRPTHRRHTHTHPTHTSMPFPSATTLDDSPKLLGGISAPGVLRLSVGQDLSVWSKSGILGCDGLISTVNVAFIWHVYRVFRDICTTPSPPCEIYREELVTKNGSSADRRQMLLRSNRLHAGARYRVSLRSLYTPDSTGRTRTDTDVTVYVSSGKVVALISQGMTEVNIHMEGGTRSLDASGSYDTADTTAARGSTAAAGRCCSCDACVLCRVDASCSCDACGSKRSRWLHPLSSCAA